MMGAPLSLWADLTGRLADEADLCRAEGADDIAALLCEAMEFIGGPMDCLYTAAANLRQAQRDYMEVRDQRDVREPFGRAVAEAADKLDDALTLAAAVRSTETRSRLGPQGRQSGPKGNAQQSEPREQEG